MIWGLILFVFGPDQASFRPVTPIGERAATPHKVSLRALFNTQPDFSPEWLN
jgi:hypothetical protein